MNDKKVILLAMQASVPIALVLRKISYDISVRALNMGSMFKKK